MFKNMKNKLNNERGLTLIELLAVIVILAIIAAIAVPAIGKVISNSHDKAILADASNILAGAKIAVVDGACGEPTSAGVTTCNAAALDDFVEAVELKPDVQNTTGDKVVRSKEGVWTVTYGKLAEIKNETKFVIPSEGNDPGYKHKATDITETSLNKALQK
jgi:type IV pilus assembly protein PilA